MKARIVIMTRKKLETKVEAAMTAGIAVGRVLGEADARGSGVVVAMPPAWRQSHGR